MLPCVKITIEQMTSDMTRNLQSVLAFGDRLIEHAGVTIGVTQFPTRESMVRIFCDHLSQHRNALFNSVVLSQEICQQHASFELLGLEGKSLFIGELCLVMELAPAKILRGRDAVGFAQVCPCQCIIGVKRNRL